MKNICVVFVLGTVLLLSAGASADVIGPWPTAGSDMWETQPISGYISGLGVEVDAATNQLWTSSSSAAQKNTWWLPYASLDPLFGGERYTAAGFIMPSGTTELTSIHLRVYDPGTAAGWAVVLRNSDGNIIDFGIRPYFATGKLRGFMYDASASTWSGNSYIASRLKNGSEYWTMDFTAADDGSVKVDWSYLDAASGGTASGTWNSGIFGDIEQLYLTASTSTTINNTKFKWTEFTWIPEPSALALLALGSLVMVRRRLR